MTSKRPRYSNKSVAIKIPVALEASVRRWCEAYRAKEEQEVFLAKQKVAQEFAELANAEDIDHLLSACDE